MSVTLTVRDVPDDVRDALARAARLRGQSLQAFLLSVLNQQAAFSRNAQLLSEVAGDLAAGSGAQADAPDAATLLEQAHPAGQAHPVGQARPEPTGERKDRRGSRSAA